MFEEGPSSLALKREWKCDRIEPGTSNGLVGWSALHFLKEVQNTGGGNVHGHITNLGKRFLADRASLLFQLG